MNCLTPEPIHSCFLSVGKKEEREIKKKPKGEFIIILFIMIGPY